MIVPPEVVCSATRPADFLALQAALGGAVADFLEVHSYTRDRLDNLSADFHRLLVAEIDGCLEKMRFLGNENADSVVLISHLISRLAYNAVRQVLKTDNEKVVELVGRMGHAIQLLVANRTFTAIHVLTCAECMADMEAGRPGSCRP